MLDFKIVQLSHFYDQYQSLEAQKLLMRVLELKLDRYRAEFGDRVLPIDTTDFVGDNYLVCLWEEGEWIPWMAHRTISRDRCQAYGLEFPPSSILRRAGHTNWAAQMERYSRRLEARPALWHSSWTFRDPKRNVPLHRLMRDLLAVLLAWEQEAENAWTSMMTGTLRFNTDRLFRSWGYREFMVGEEPVRFEHPQIAGTPCLMMYNEGFSAHALELKEQYRSLWEQRVRYE